MEAYPPEEAEVVSKTEIDGNPKQLFLNGDTLVIFTVTSDEGNVIPDFQFIPVRRYVPVTHALVYDVSDRENPQLINDFNIDGDYFQARMIGDRVYFVSRESVYFWNDIVDLPAVREGRKQILLPDIYYFGNPEDSYIFHIVASFDVDGEDTTAQTFMMGYSNTLYFSEENMYLAYHQRYRSHNYQKESEERFFSVIVPLLPSDLSSEMKDLRESASSSGDRWQKISVKLADYYSSLEDEDRAELFRKIEEAAGKYDAERALERDKTIIQKISIADGHISPGPSASVKRSLLNQFSLDEHDGNLRVATSTNVWAGLESIHHNNVFVLDEDMEVIGPIEGIAPGEAIYSTRFIGERLYMVTFERMDPFFVIDLSDPTDPGILGELKIPGFSDYLHPYDEDHIIGIGKDTGENEWGGISTKGLKVALFDVSDPSDPRQIDSEVIGGASADSEALSDHKASLFDKEKGIMVIPVTDWEEVERRYPYSQDVWQGVYIFEVTSDGIDLKGKVVHFDGRSDYYYSQQVRRSLYIEDVLYILSPRKVIMTDLEDLSKLGEITPLYKQDEPYPYPVIENFE